MKCTKKLFGFTVIFAVIVFLALPLTGCPADDDDPTPTPPPVGKTVTFDYIGDDVADFATWLAAQPDRTQPYNVKLNLSSLGGAATSNGSLGYVFRNTNNKFVSLDLSGSTFTEISASIADWSPFYGCLSLVSVTLPNTITSIGDNAFNSAGLTSVTIPNTVTSIGNNAFYQCFLTSITIPNSVTSIKYQAFRGCTGLTSVTIPASVTSIGGSAFSSCTGLTSITIPNGVTSIGDYAFSSCTGLTSITIPASVTSIENNAFNCSKLASVTFQGTITANNLGKVLNGTMYSPFYGDLRDKYLAGGTGTYKTTAPVDNSSVWTKQ